MRWWEFEVMPKPNATEEKKKMDSFQQFDETTPRTMHLTWDTSKRKKKKMNIQETGNSSETSNKKD